MSKIVFSGVGHGGNDNGAVANGLREDDMNLVEALACNEVLVAHGVKNPMSRYKDEADPIDEEVREANASGAVIAVDFHNNAGGGDGFEAYYSIGDAEGLKLCKFIEEEVVKLGQNSRGCKTKVGYGGKDYFAFIRDTKMTAIILEGAFLDSEDRKFKDTKEEQRAYGVAVAKGILRYLGIQYKGDTNTINKPKPVPDPKPSKTSKETIDVTYQVYSNKKWLPNVTNLSDYAGIYGTPIQAIYTSLGKGSIQYRTHTQRGSWLPWVTNRTDYAGILGKNIDGIQMKISGLSGYNVKYRAYVGGRWLPWVVGLEDYAGLYGKAIEGIQVQVIKK